MADELRPGDAEHIIEATIVASERLAARSFGGVPCSYQHAIGDDPMNGRNRLRAVGGWKCPACGAAV